MKKRYQLFLFMICISLQMLSQSNLPIGSWKSHLSYKTGTKLTKTKDKIVYASARGIFSIDQQDLSVKFLSKEDNLSDIIVNNLYYDHLHDQLIIIYADNNIDIIKENEVINIPAVKNNTSIIGSKNINDVFIANDIAYIATDFGVLGFNLMSYEFVFTTFTSQKINCVALWGDRLFAASDLGVYHVPIEGSNISDFYSWTSLLTSNASIEHMAVKFNKLYVSTYLKVSEVGNDFTLKPIYEVTEPNEEIQFLSEDGNHLMVGISKGTDGKTLFFNANTIETQKSYGCIHLLRYAVQDSKGRVWYADLWDPIKYTETATGDCKFLNFGGPFENEASSIRFKGEKAYSGSNGVSEDFNYNYNRFGFYTLQDNIWTNYNQQTFGALQTFDFQNIKTLAPHPSKEELYLGSYYNGLLFVDEKTGETKHWNKDNSVLQAVVGDAARTRIAGLAFDRSENLWISNYGAPKPLIVKTKEDTWHTFSVPTASQLHQIAIDQSGNKWIAVYGVGNGLLVYNEGSKISDPTDDKSRSINRNNSEIKGNKVNCVAVDLDGSVWVGTDEGPVVFDCGDPFASVCVGSTRKVIVDNIPAPLLRYEDILSIGIDGANRKWFGTRNGIFVQSPDAITQIAKFDVKNSPLLDNTVRELSYNATTGEMFIITSGGIQSYKTETIEGKSTHSSNVYAFPNPVRPEYTGIIAIKGLARDANVKITDVNGKLVYETKALGGQAIWDGMDYNGIKAATGVYLVFSAADTNAQISDALVTKILIVH